MKLLLGWLRHSLWIRVIISLPFTKKLRSRFQQRLFTEDKGKGKVCHLPLAGLGDELEKIEQSFLTKEITIFEYAEQKNYLLHTYNYSLES